MTTRTVNIQLVIDAHPAFSEEQLLSDLRRGLPRSEPEPTRKPGRSAWHVTHSSVAFASLADAGLDGGAWE